jgi:hypothetical protein
LAQECFGSRLAYPNVAQAISLRYARPTIEPDQDCKNVGNDKALCRHLLRRLKIKLLKHALSRCKKKASKPLSSVAIPSAAQNFPIQL